MTKQSFLYSAFIMGFSAAAANAQYSVWIDMASTDITSGLTNVSCCDGNTQASNVGGLDCRKNTNTISDFYFYFAISDSFAFAGNHPDLWITVHYYDNGTGVLTLEYDATSSAYKSAATVALANSNTWKAFGWHVIDGYFGNRQNGGADFRISRSTVGDFYMDLAYVRNFCPGAPCVSIVPQPGWDTGAQPFRDLFEQANQWTTARSMIDTIGYYDHRVNTFSDTELSLWLPQITAWGKRFSIETGAVKEFCHGATCFNPNKPTYDRFQNLGATLNFNMDEPLTAVHANSLGTDAYAVQETATWMQLVRQNYPNARITSIEAYPYLSQTTLQNWIRDLNNRCAAIGIQGLDSFMLDADWRNFPGNGSWPGVKTLENFCHNRGVPFSNIYWASPHSTSTNDCNWSTDITTEGTSYQNAGGTPDEYNIESWLNIPTVTVPDTTTCTFTRSIKDFAVTFVPQTCSGQCPYGGSPRSIAGVIQAEDYDVGGEGVAYHDLIAGNSGGTYRSDNVDISTTTDTGGGFCVSGIDTAEWLEYTVNVITAGTYGISMRVASPNAGGTYHVEINGTNVTGTKTVPNTGGFQTWTTVASPNISLSSGQQVWRVYIESGGWNFNYVDIESVPGAASVPDPANSATNVATNATLGWTAGSTATSHDVYFGTTSPGTFQGNQAGTSYNPGTLVAGTIYYWRIDEKNTFGTTTGTVWNFTTVPPPGPADNPSPANGTTGLGTTVSLNWTAGSTATSHDVYFGTSSPGAFQGNQAGTNFNPPTLSPGTTYYWRIDEKNANGTTTGTVWTLKTASVPRADFDADGDVDQSDFGHLQACFNPSGPTSGCEESDLNGSNSVDVADFNAFLPCMAGPNHAPGC